MSEESRSHFKLERNGVRVEITGSWSFVQSMYREVMRDVDRPVPDEPEEPSEKSHSLDHVVWIVRYDELMRRIYMADARDFAASRLHSVLDSERLGTLYVAKSEFEELLPAVAAGEETLWARLTEAGRRELAEADR